MSDLSISALGALTGATLAATDLEVVVDVSDTTMAPTGTDRKMTVTEKLNGYAPKMFNDRGVVANSTVYPPWDMVLLANGLQIVFKQQTSSSSTGTVPILGSNGLPNYFVVNVFQMVSGYLCGISAGNGASVNTLAFAVAFGQANATGANATGRMVELPPGVLSVGPSSLDATACIHVPNGCGMYGQGKIGTYLSLATGSNCSVIRFHTSSGSGNANAFFCHLYNFGIDGRGTQQGVQINDCTLVAASATIVSSTHTWVDNEYVVGSGILPDTRIVPGSQTGGGLTATMTNVAQQAITGNAIVWAVSQQCFGVLSRSNPLLTAQSGDWGFDLSHCIEGLYMKNVLHDCIRLEGRSDITIRNCRLEQSWSNGITTTFDTTLSDNNIGFMAWHGIVIDGSAVHLTNNKTYNMGQFTGGAGAAWNAGIGVKATSRNGIVISSHDCQQISGSSFQFFNCKGVNLQAISSTPGFQTGTTLARAGAFHIELDNCSGCIIDIAGFSGGTDTGPPTTGRGYRLVNGSDKNYINMTHLGAAALTPGPAESSDTVRLANAIIVNGAVVQFPSLAVSGRVVVGAAALATNATDGFLYIPTCAGTPTGVPGTQTGTVPIIFDTTNNFLYAYNGGAWKKTTVFA